MTTDYTIISDLEGFNIPEFTTKRLVITGDLIDSAGAAGYNVAKTILNHKSYNLRNIHKVISNNNIDIILGNRDINKLKCYILCKLKGETDVIKKFNFGKIDLTEENYNLLKTNINWIEDMRDWYPFWNPNMFINDNKMFNQWKTLPPATTFLDRFNQIFGPDGSVGTMGAPYLLHAIPLELNISGDDDFKAFICLAIFNSMTCPITPSMMSYTMVTRYSSVTNILEYDENKYTYYIPPKPWDELDKKNSSFVRGWLYMLYRKSCVVKIIETDNKIILLSHGGITKELANVENISDIFKTYENMYNKKSFSASSAMIGGGLYNVTDIVSDKKLRSLVFNYNELFKKYILDFYKVLDPAKLFVLLVLSAPFDTNKYNTHTKRQLNILYSPTSLYSPILSGINLLRKSYFTSNKHLYQVIGHAPNGFAPSIDVLVNDKNKEAYVINMDTSNSYYSSSLFIPTDDNVKRFSTLKINGDRLTMNSYIDITNIPETGTFQDKDKNNISYKPLDKDASFTGNEIIINMDVNDMIINSKNIGQDIFYHGQMNNYDIYTKNIPDTFNKILYIRENQMRT